MSIFGNLLSAATRVAITPVTLATDAVKFIPDSMDNDPRRSTPFNRTANNLSKAFDEIESLPDEDDLI